MGNRLSDVTATANRQASYPTTSNRLTSLTENAAAFRSYTYDGAGNTLTETRPGESFAYTYNKRNRLASVTRNGAAWASYGYNAFELLVSRSSSHPGAPVGTVHYIYDLDGHVISEADGATGAKLRDYVWLPSNDSVNDTLAEDYFAANDNAPPDLPLAVVDGVNTATPVTAHIHADHLGRPIRMTNAAKATVWSATWKPWGEAHTITGTSTNNLRFPGQYFQIETGLAYNWHRHYDPVTGRYTQPDPLGFVDGPSVYAYAGSSPFMFTDRAGLEPQGGERGATGGVSGQNTNNPYKGCRNHPTDPTKIRCRHHQTGKWVVKPKPADWPEDKAQKSCEGCAEAAVGVAIGVTAGYVIYRCVRMAPSLAPPLWWTIPANAAVP